METEQDTQRRVKRGCSGGRLTNLVMAFFYLLVMITAVIVVGVLGAVNLSLGKYTDALGNVPCPLFMGRDCNSDGLSCLMVYGNVSVCIFIQVSFGLIGLVSLLYLVIHIIRAVRQYDIWMSVIVDFVMVCSLGVACFTTAVTISIGLAITCDRLAEQYSYTDSCDVTIPLNVGDLYGGPFYNSVSIAQASAWVCMLLIIILLPLVIVRLVLYIKRRKRVTMEDRDELLVNDDKTDGAI